MERNSIPVSAPRFARSSSTIPGDGASPGRYLPNLTMKVEKDGDATVERTVDR